MAGPLTSGNPRETEDLRLELHYACRRHFVRRNRAFGSVLDAETTNETHGQGGEGSFSGTGIPVPGSHRDGGWFLKGVTGR